MEMTVGMTVAQLASAVSVSPDTVRYYERVGLLPRPPRTPSGYRMYPEETIDRIRFLKGAQRLGLRLSEIRELLDVRDRGLCPCGHADGLLRARIDALDTEIAALEAVRAELVRIVSERREASPSNCMGDVFQLAAIRGGI